MHYAEDLRTMLEQYSENMVKSYLAQVEAHKSQIDLKTSEQLVRPVHSEWP
jgi:hypothetical protein